MNVPPGCPTELPGKSMNEKIDTGRPGVQTTIASHVRAVPPFRGDAGVGLCGVREDILQ